MVPCDARNYCLTPLVSLFLPRTSPYVSLRIETCRSLSGESHTLAHLGTEESGQKTKFSNE